MGKRLDRMRTAWISARVRASDERQKRQVVEWKLAAEQRERLALEGRLAVLVTGEQVPAQLHSEVTGELHRAHDSLDRMARLAARWRGDTTSLVSRAQVCAEVVEALNRPDTTDVRMTRLRTHTQTLREALGAASQRAELAEALQREAEVQRDRALELLNRVAQVQTFRLTDDGPRLVEARVLLNALELAPQPPQAPQQPPLPVRPR